MRPNRFACTVAALIGATTLMTLLPAQAAGAAEPAGIGFELRPQSSAADIGLPVYPGAVQRRAPDEDGAGLTLALWGGRQGFRLSLLKFSSSDPIDRVAAFYRDAMAVHGTVIDCARPAPSSGDKDALRCDETLAPGTRLYKVGRSDRYRVVSLKSVDGRVEFDLVHLHKGR